jgi:hypothetical protein
MLSLFMIVDARVSFICVDVPMEWSSSGRVRRKAGAPDVVLTLFGFSKTHGEEPPANLRERLFK